jgi:LPXTG-site transpeptidase (sortase) family protein
VILASAGAALASHLAGAPREPTGHAQAPASATPSPSAAPVPPQTPTPSAAPTPDLTAAQARLPARLVIPGIGVDASVEAVATDAQGNMDVPRLASDVGWYEPGPAPGDAGDAVIDGHRDWYSGPAVFARLPNVRVGDEVRVLRRDGGALRFRVASAVSVPATAHPAGLFATSGPPRLSLITCTGPWDARSRTYPQRLVLDATLVGA